MSFAERDQQVIWHPLYATKNRLLPVPIVKGAGSLLFAEDGENYIDAISSWRATLHGHVNSYIAKKIYEQALNWSR